MARAEAGERHGCAHATAQLRLSKYYSPFGLWRLLGNRPPSPRFCLHQQNPPSPPQHGRLPAHRDSTGVQ